MSLDLELEEPSQSREALRRAGRADARADVPKGLTAGDLIALLEHLDPATPVVIGGEYGGYESAQAIARVPVRFNVNSMDGFGPHERTAPGEPPDAHAVVVGMKSGWPRAE